MWAALSCGFGPKNKLTNDDVDAGRWQSNVQHQKQQHQEQQQQQLSSEWVAKYIFNGRMKL